MDYLKQESAQTTATTTAAPEETTTTSTTTTAAPDTTAPAETTAAPTTTTDIDMGRVDESYVSLYGDVNCDGTIDILDAVLLQKYLNGSVQLNYTQLANADCQKDSELDNTDAVSAEKFHFSAGCITRQNNKTDKTTNAVPGVIWVQRFCVRMCVVV